MADETREDTYDPSTAQVDRSRMQGLGVGARDLQRQDDAGQAATEATPSGPPGKPDEAYDARDSDEVDITQPSGGAGAV